MTDEHNVHVTGPSYLGRSEAQLKWPGTKFTGLCQPEAYSGSCLGFETSSSG
jgi:hypothetical protein